MTRIEKKLTALAREFDFREIRIQTEDRNEYFARFENGRCVGLWDMTMPEEQKAKLEMVRVKWIIDRHHDAGWLLGYHHEEGDGFVYRCADGLYEERARIAREETEVAA